jgi:hypothetical protein
MKNHFNSPDSILAQELYNNKEVLSKEEAKLVNKYVSSPLLIYNGYSKSYLNLNVYSEVEKEEFDFRKEKGI